MKGKLKRGDIVIIAVVLLLASSIFLSSTFGIFREQGELAILSYDGGEMNFSLTEDTEYSFESRGYTLTMIIENGQAYIKSSDCPDKTCVNSGRIDRSSQLIACIPAGATLRIEGRGESYDFVAG